MNRFVLTLPVTFTIGFAIAWTGKPVNRPPEEALISEDPVVSPRPPRAPRASTTLQRDAVERVEGYLLRYDGQAAKGYVTSNLFDNVPVGDIPLLIEQWTKRAGYGGLGSTEQSFIIQLAMKWYESEPQAALDWAAGMECQRDRQALISGMVGAEAERDFEHAIELARQYGKAEFGGLGMPPQISAKLGQCDPARYMEILQLFGSTDSPVYVGDADFKENYDFAGLAAVLDKAAGETKDEPFSRNRRNLVPPNFLKEWAEIDPSAAWEWGSKEGASEQMQSSWQFDFFSVLAKTRSKQQINDFVIDEMSKRTDDESKFKIAWYALTSKPDAVQTADFINRMPGDRGENLEKLAKSTTGGGGGSFDDFKQILAEQMTAKERMQILPKVRNFVHQSDFRKAMANTLRQLGHTDAEINAMLPFRGE